jgi:chromosomal replication initiator protein
MDAKQVWRAALGELQVSLSQANFETWLKDTALVDVNESTFTIAVPNGFAKDWLETRYRSLISQTLARVVGYSVQLDFEVREVPPQPEDAVPTQAVRLEPSRVGGEGPSASLNPRYTFSTFIVGSANRLAHAASLSVAERPGHAYNPLFLYGGVGLGKTHLMHAIGNQVVARISLASGWSTPPARSSPTSSSPASSRAASTTSGRATGRSTCCSSTTSSSSPTRSGRRKSSSIPSTPSTRTASRSCSRPTDRQKPILTLEERLRSRFEWGLIADLTAPDLETRIAILRAKAEENGVPIGQDVLEFIARKVVSNIRELEGALNRIVAYASMGAMPITIDLAQASSPTCSTTPNDAASPRAHRPGGLGVLWCRHGYAARPESATRRSCCRARWPCT